MTRQVTDRQGKLIGRIDETSSATLYYTATGRYLGKFFDGKTVDERGVLVGRGDQGMGLIHDAND